MEKFYIVSNDSALGEKYLEYLETVNKITDLFRDFSVRNNIHTNSFYPTVTRLWIDLMPRILRILQMGLYLIFRASSN